MPASRSRHLRLQHQPARHDHPAASLDRHRATGGLSTQEATASAQRRLWLGELGPYLVTAVVTRRYATKRVG
jgi:hypothetical protein